MVKTGLAQFLADPRRWTHRGRVGLLCHAASVLPDLTHAVDALLANPDVHLTALFGPQHGVTAHTQDNMIEWQGFRDARTGLPVHSLYGEHRQPTDAMLQDLDVLVIDLQDVGTRVYTFIWTMALAMVACGRADKPVVVLDRPNPIGDAVEGPWLMPGFESFIGLHSLPLRHGMTIGQIARWLVAEEGVACELAVVNLGDHLPSDWFDATGLPWVLPSPNMPTLETATVYPGAVLLEGTTLSEGRGTTRPFELLGHPAMDAHGLAAVLHRLDLPGVRFRPTVFQPTFQKQAGVPCAGLQVHVTDRASFRPVLTYAVLLTELHRLQPGVLTWLQPPYEYVHDRMPIDILSGGPDLRSGVEAGRDVGPWIEALAT